MELTQDFHHLDLMKHANEVPALQKTEVRPVAVLRFRGVADPQGIVTGQTPATLRGVSHIIVDFGRELVGFLDITAAAHTPSGMIVTYGESIEEACDTACDCDNCCWFHLPEDTHTVQGAPTAYRHEGRRAFRYVHVRSEQPDARIELHSMRMTLVHYPVQDRGSFSSSDPLINRIWDLCRYTTQLCMQTFYEDGIKRDGLLWVSDYRQQFLSNWTPFGDAALARRSLIMFAATQMADGFIPACAAAAGGHQHTDGGFHPVDGISYMPGIPFKFGTAKMLLIHYSSDYLSCLLDYVLHTGDTALLDSVWPTVQRLIAAHEKHPYAPGKTYATEWYGWNSLGTMLVQVITGMRDGARLAALHGDPAIGARCGALADRLQQRVLAEHFDPAAGIFTDDPSAGAGGVGGMHVNTFAVLSGTVDRTNGRCIIEKAIAAKARQAEWSGMRMWQHAGEFEVGMADVALQGMRAFWGFMLDRGATTAWESCDRKPDGGWRKPIISRCHGWGGTACHLLSRYVLGVRPTAPGFARVRMCPQLGDLQWAEGVVPTPRGDIRIELDAKTGGRAIVPAGIEVEPGCTIEVCSRTPPKSRSS
ncbi:MAG: hypothetical protein FJ222_09240 [Lentisphaerae bacterium]|nr:hypothetical protein [Lentisphaerota bacterium]